MNDVDCTHGVQRLGEGIEHKGRSKQQLMLRDEVKGIKANESRIREGTCKIAALPRRREEWKMDSEQKHRK